MWIPRTRVCSLCLPDYAEKAVKTVNLIAKSSCLYQMQLFIFWGWPYGYCQKESYCGSICPKGTFFSQHQQSICFTFFSLNAIFFSFFRNNVKLVGDLPISTYNVPHQLGWRKIKSYFRTNSCSRFCLHFYIYIPIKEDP